MEPMISGLTCGSFLSRDGISLGHRSGQLIGSGGRICDIGRYCALRVISVFSELKYISQMSCNPHYSFNKHPKKFLHLPRLAPMLTDGSDEPFLGMKESCKEYELNEDQPSASSVTFKIQRAFT
jgi:hypothetical protein